MRGREIDRTEEERQGERQRGWVGRENKKQQEGKKIEILDGCLRVVVGVMMGVKSGSDGVAGGGKHRGYTDGAGGCVP